VFSENEDGRKPREKKTGMAKRRGVGSNSIAEGFALTELEGVELKPLGGVWEK
jgi:hypothetical protein